jgi:hypothetical protein
MVHAATLVSLSPFSSLSIAGKRIIIAKYLMPQLIEKRIIIAKCPMPQLIEKESPYLSVQCLS